MEKISKSVIIASVLGIIIILGLVAFTPIIPILFDSSPTSNHQVVVVPMTAQQFYFNVTKITVHYNDYVKIIGKSLDVVHGFGLNAFGVAISWPVGQWVTFGFVANRVGNFTWYCTTYCGTGHYNMTGVLTVLPNS